MTETVLIIVLLACLIVVCVGACVIAGIFAWQTHRKLMWFHNAGGSLASYELKKAELDIQSRQVEVDRTKAQTELKHAEARTDSTARALAGGHFRGPASRILETGQSAATGMTPAHG